MHNATYDSRFFVEFFYSKNETVHRKLEEEKKRKEKYVSAIVIHEVYKLSLAREGRETARLRATLMKKDFKVVPVDDQIAQISAELRQKYGLSMGDSMIAATASILKAVCVSDDPHFQQIKEIKTTWI
jgi:predicted nucleic acid-binding protein